MKGLTDIPGIRVGHVSDFGALTGCTAILCEQGAVAGVDIRGSATGTEEIATLDPGHVTDRIHGVLLAGGSAFYGHPVASWVNGAASEGVRLTLPNLVHAGSQGDFTSFGQGTALLTQLQNDLMALLDSVLNVDGLVQAKGLVERDGHIYLDGGRSGVTRVTGTLDTSAARVQRFHLSQGRNLVTVAVQANEPSAAIESADTWQRKFGSMWQPGLLATTFPASSTMSIATTTGFEPTFPTVHCATCWKKAP